LDANDNANWQAYSQLSSNTIIDTGVAGADQENFEAVLDVDAQTINFFINGNNVGTISTNIPEEPLMFHCGAFNTTTATAEISVDFFELQDNR